MSLTKFRNKWYFMGRSIEYLGLRINLIFDFPGGSEVKASA